MSPCICGSPGGSGGNLSLLQSYSHFNILGVETQVECAVEKTIKYLSFDQNCVASTEESDMAAIEFAKQDRNEIL